MILWISKDFMNFKDSLKKTIITHSLLQISIETLIFTLFFVREN